jgi:hypothetical protein
MSSCISTESKRIREGPFDAYDICELSSAQPEALGVGLFVATGGIGDLVEALTGGAVDEATSSGAIDRVVIGKVADLGDEPLAPGERTLFDQLPPQGNEAANWAQNERVLLQEMKSGNPIRDATVEPITGELANNTGFLAMERGVLEREGWNYDPLTHLWSPGG